jgi:hypothetical protein
LTDAKGKVKIYLKNFEENLMKENIIDLIPDARHPGRREFFVTSVLAGTFAPATQPIVAQTKIITDASGFDCRRS